MKFFSAKQFCAYVCLRCASEIRFFEANSVTTLDTEKSKHTRGKASILQRHVVPRAKQYVPKPYCNMLSTSYAEIDRKFLTIEYHPPRHSSFPHSLHHLPLRNFPPSPTHMSIPLSFYVNFYISLEGRAMVTSLFLHPVTFYFVLLHFFIYPNVHTTISFCTSFKQLHFHVYFLSLI